MADIPIGSHITEDIKTANGALLIKSGTEVTDKIFNMIQNYVGKVTIEVEVNDNVTIEYDDSEEQDKIFKLSDSIKKRALESAELLYSGDNKETIAQSAMSVTDAIISSLESSKSVSISLEALKVSDEYTFKHSVDVGSMAMIIARKLGETNKFVQDIALAGVLHDLGKSKIPLEILNKPAKLDPDEWEVMKQHSVFSYRLIQDIDSIPLEVKKAVLEHHENEDGTGYPMGIKGDQICKMAKILAVADVYDALVTERPYKEAKNPADALEMILGMSNKFDLEILKVFISCVILYPIGSTIKLSNDALCIVLKNNENYPLRPVCQNIVTGEKYDLLNDFNCLSLVIS